MADFFDPFGIIEGGMDLFGSLSGADAILGASRDQEDLIRQGMEEISSGRGAALEALGGGRATALTALTGGGAFNPRDFGQGLTLQGFGQSLSNIMSPTGALAPLIAQRQQAATDALGTAGLTRSNVAAERAAEIPFEAALGLENMLFGRQADVASGVGELELGFGTNVANLETGTSASLANLLAAIGNARAQGAAGAAEARGGLLGDVIGGVGAAIGLSDERLKTNIKEISRDGPFTFYSWDWIPEMESLRNRIPLMNVGLMAQDVQKIAPEYVYDVNGILGIDYLGLVEDERWLH